MSVSNYEYYLLTGLVDLTRPRQGDCTIKEAAIDVTDTLGNDIQGQVLLIPSSMEAGNIARILKEGYDVGVLSRGLNAAVSELELDVLLIDTHPGLNEETLLSLALSDTLFVVLRPDQQDFEGTGVTIRVAERLKVQNTYVIINKIPDTYNRSDITAQVEKTFDTKVAAAIPHCDELMTLGSQGIFSLKYPDHCVTELYQHIADRT